MEMMSARQFSEMLLFFRMEREEREELEAQAQESNLRQFMSRKIARQARGDE